MTRYLTSLACSGLLSIGTLSGFSALAMANSASIPDIAPTVDAAGQAFHTLPARSDDNGVWNLGCAAATNCDQGGFQPGVYVHQTSDLSLGDSGGGIQLVRGGGGGGGGGGHGFGGGGHGFGGGGTIIRGGGFHGGGFHGMGGGGWNGGGWNGGGWHGGHGFGGGWNGGGWHGAGGGNWHGNGWRGNGWRGNNNFFDGGGGFFGFGLPIYGDYYGDDYGYNYPYYNNYYAQPISQSHVSWCYSRYRSYRAADNTFQPSYGPRRLCVSPY